MGLNGGWTGMGLNSGWTGMGLNRGWTQTEEHSGVDRDLNH